MKINSGIWGAGVIALVLVACGGGEGANAAATSVGVASDASTSSSESGGGLVIAGSVDDSDLLVPRDYLQGEWCASDGNAVTVEGDIARIEDASGGVFEAPIDLVFLDGPGESLVSQTDDQFVVESGGDEVTFSRGSC